MEITTKTKKHVSEKMLSVAVVITIMASFVLAVWQIPAATASSLEEISVSREISAPVDQVCVLFQTSTTRQNIGLLSKLSKISTKQAIQLKERSHL